MKARTKDVLKALLLIAFSAASFVAIVFPAIEDEGVPAVILGGLLGYYLAYRCGIALELALRWKKRTYLGSNYHFWFPASYCFFLSAWFQAGDGHTERVVLGILAGVIFFIAGVSSYRQEHSDS